MNLGLGHPGPGLGEAGSWEELCPAGWREGRDPTRASSKEGSVVTRAQPVRSCWLWGRLASAPCGPAC